MQNSTDAAATAVGTGIAGGLLVLWILLVVVGLVFFIWWIVLLVDCVKRDFPDKTTWLIVLIVGFVLGFVWLVDIIYYFSVIRKFRDQGLPQGQAPAPQQQPPAAPKK